MSANAALAAYRMQGLSLVHRIVSANPDGSRERDLINFGSASPTEVRFFFCLCPQLAVCCAARRRRTRQIAFGIDSPLDGF